MLITVWTVVKALFRSKAFDGKTVASNKTNVCLAKEL